MSRLAAAVAVSCLMACSAHQGSGGAPDLAVFDLAMSDMPQPICQAMLSGAMSGSSICTVSASYESAKNVSYLYLPLPAAQSGGVTPQASVGTTGRFVVGTLADSDANALGGIAMCGPCSGPNASVAQWAAYAGAGGPTPQGSFTLSLTSVATTPGGGGDQTYELHGALAATLTPVAGTAATGNIFVAATF